ncbi:MAG: hypothetical protein KME64_25085 [Scytonematopsis contorta HA4267-MV1]|nr:hypothetical protein [Scytonematopsis contorta HA4267-MV1]
MTIFNNFLRSLFLTMIFSFLAPIFLVGATLLILSFMGYIPGLQDFGSAIATQIIQFLSTFGSGSPGGGIFIIALAWSLVGGLFDTYVHYRCQILRLDS